MCAVGWVGGIKHWLGRRPLASWFSLTLTVHYGSTNQPNSAFHPSGVRKWVVIQIIAWPTGVDHIKTTDQGYTSLFGCRPKSVSASLGCGLVCTLPMCVTHSATAVCRLWRNISSMFFPVICSYDLCTACWFCNFADSFRHLICTIHMHNLL